MSKRRQSDYSFLSGYVQDKNVCRVLAQINELRNKGSTSSGVMSWKQGQWYSHDIDWTSTRIDGVTEPELEIIAIGPDGIALIVTMQGVTEENIDDSDEGPDRRGDMRDLRYIGHHFYAVGMSRQVYRRESPGKWSRQDAGVVLPPGDLTVCGFNAIDGLNEKIIYAVGFNGEIWQRKNSKWQQVDSPTNAVLHRVRVIKKDVIFACGQNGVLLRSDGKTWDFIDQEATTEDLWGMEWFKDKLYLSCDDGMFVLEGDDSLTKVKLEEGWTCRHLHANDGVLWSFGPRHLAWTDDGEKWNDVTP